MPQLVLHQWEISPFCTKVRAILDHKGLPFEICNYNGLLARKAAALTPVGKLPVLDYDGERIGDSSTIASVLDERHPDPPLMPDDPAARVQARVWEDWGDESLYWYLMALRWSDENEGRTVAQMSASRLVPSASVG